MVTLSRRVFPRIKCNIPIELTPTNEVKCSAATAINYSKTGMYFTSRQALGKMRAALNPFLQSAVIKGCFGEPGGARCSGVRGHPNQSFCHLFGDMDIGFYFGLTPADANDITE
jgi:hypothetical protein